MIRHRVEQRTEEWHGLRYGKIGGTGSKGLHVKSSTLLYRLAACRMEPFEHEEVFAGKAAERGVDMEPLALEQAERYIGKKFNDYGWLESEECSLIGYSPDGLTASGTDGIELKCPSASVHFQYCYEDVVPVDYVHQIIHAFAVNKKLKRMYFVSYRPESKVPLFVKAVKRTDDINIGTAARPKIEEVGVVADMKLKLAKELEKQIKLSINQVTF